jgi:D-alanyl-D-alanine carboxypeptidase
MPFISFIFRSLALLTMAATLAGAQSLPPSVEQALRRAQIPLSAVAGYVQEVDGGRPVLAHNALLAMNPASTMKLVTTYAALDLLGPTYTWKTEAYAGTGLQGDTLQGDLVLKGYGDPKLTLENFWLLLRKLRALGCAKSAATWYWTAAISRRPNTTRRNSMPSRCAPTTSARTRCCSISRRCASSSCRTRSETS